MRTSLSFIVSIFLFSALTFSSVQACPVCAVPFVVGSEAATGATAGIVIGTGAGIVYNQATKDQVLPKDDKLLRDCASLAAGIEPRVFSDYDPAYLPGEQSLLDSYQYTPTKANFDIAWSETKRYFQRMLEHLNKNKKLTNKEKEVLEKEIKIAQNKCK